MNLADISDMLCLAEPNIEAAVGILVMKHAFDSDGMKKIVDELNKMLSKLENSARATLVDKIVLYLGEYIDEDVVEELRMQMSIGQVLGIPTAGDRRRAAERAALRRGTKKGADKRNIEVALDMLADSKPIEEIVKYSRLPKEKVLELRDSRPSFTAK